MDSQEYWKQREQENLKKNLKAEKEYTKEINSYYDYMMDQIQKEIDGFYAKYAKKEGITLAEAKKRVSKLDMEAYGRKAEKYVKNKDFSEEANAEMRLYNATMKINRLEMLKANIGLELVDGFDDLQKYFDKILTDRTLGEFERQAGILGGTIGNNAKAAHAIVNASFGNAKYSDRIWMYQDMMKAELSKLLQQGLIQGKNPRQLARHLEKLFGVSKQNAERLMRTELARVQTEAQKQSFVENGFTQYEFIALGSACDICKKIDGKHFDVEKMMPGTNAPPMHPNCRCSIAAWEDDDDYEAWLDYLDKGGATEEWERLKKKKKESIIEPRDEGEKSNKTVYSSQELLRKSREVNEYLNTLNIPRSKWSGMTFVKSKEELRKAHGVKKRSCDIWLREDAEIKTIIHEHLHARSSSWMISKLRKDLGFEEGACELLAEEICKNNKIPYKPTYAKFVNPLRDFRKLHGRYSNDYDFAIELFNIDMDKRESWLKSLAEEKDLLTSIKLKFLIRRVKNNEAK